MTAQKTNLSKLISDYSSSLIERGFHRGNLRTLKPFQSTCLQHTDRIILGMVLTGNLEIQTALGIYKFQLEEEFLLPANLHLQVSAGLNGATIFLGKQKKVNKPLKSLK